MLERGMDLKDRKKNNLKGFKFTKSDWELSLIALPTFIWFVVFAYIPMSGVLLAFKDFRNTPHGFIHSFMNSKWVGFENFEFLFASNEAWIAIRNTILYNIVFIILGVVIPVCLALLLNEILQKTLGKVFQTIMFFPHFLSWVVVSYLAFAFLSSDKGLINSVLTSFGQDPISWYSQAEMWPGIIIIMNVWKTMGYGAVVYLAAIAGIDKTYYEAALIDGATKWQQIKFITLPFLKPIMTIMFIMAVGKIFNADFGLFYQLPRDAGALYPVTNVIDTYVYRALMGMGDVGMSSAAAVFQSGIGCMTIITANWVVRRLDNENAMF
ncbi:MAG: ABC transporter permease subunit [Niameybacter sp.]